MRTHSGPPTLSRRKATFAAVTALMVAMGLLTIALIVGSPEPTPTQPTAPVAPPTNEPNRVGDHAAERIRSRT